ncbi:MAG TPA: peroxiredoxin [Mycobacteriales bacterium]|nr:peroxiredoxin [Mycobacteriales bacterium]
MDRGDKAPDFELPDENGTPRRLADFLALGPTVLFFYPIAMTPGCTAEACHFRDMAAEYGQAGVQRVGISVDPVAKQKEFTQKHAFGFPLLSDVGGTVAARYGVKRGLLGKLAPVQRRSFVIDRDGTIVGVVKSETKMHLHARRALEIAAGRS